MLIPCPSTLSIRNCFRRHFHGNTNEENSPRNSRSRILRGVNAYLRNSVIAAFGGGCLLILDNSGRFYASGAAHTVMILRQLLAAWALLTGGHPANESLSSQSTITRVTETRSPAYYTTRFDYVNVDSFLSNSRLVNSYLSCITDKGPCTKEGNELKVIIPDAIKTDCSKCTDRQRTGIEKVIQYLSVHKKEQWMDLLQKIDPEGNSRPKYTLGAHGGFSPYV